MATNTEVFNYPCGQLGDLELIIEAVERGCEDNIVIRVAAGKLKKDSTIFRAAYRAFCYLSRLGVQVVHEEVGLIGEDGYSEHDFFDVSN